MRADFPAFAELHEKSAQRPHYRMEHGGARRMNVGGTGAPVHISTDTTTQISTARPSSANQPLRSARGRSLSGLFTALPFVIRCVIPRLPGLLAPEATDPIPQGEDTVPATDHQPAHHGHADSG